VQAVNSHGGSGLSSYATDTPAENNIPVNFGDYSFELGKATADYIFAEYLPLSVFSHSGRNWDRLTRVKETAIGNLVTDSVAWYVREKYASENIDFVFLNGAYIDNAITATRTITISDILTIVAPENRDDTVTILTLKGSDVKALFDYAAAEATHSGRGGGFFSTGTKFWPIVSSEINYTIKYPEAPAGEAKSLDTQEEQQPYLFGEIKAGTLKLNNQDIDDNTDYRIATTSTLATGAFYYILATNGTNVTRTLTPFWHGIAEYIYEQGQVEPYLDARIIVEGGVPLGPSGTNNTPGALD
jgi:hypothetical protein